MALLWCVVNLVAASFSCFALLIVRRYYVVNLRSKEGGRQEKGKYPVGGIVMHLSGCQLYRRSTYHAYLTCDSRHASDGLVDTSSAVAVCGNVVSDAYETDDSTAIMAI
eukprot:scaffold99877_cov13-Prasinocladus_malaysianus.AAC.1